MADKSVFVDAGRRGARRRWGEHSRIVRLDALDDEQRALVHAFVRMAEAVADKRRSKRARPATPAAA